MPRTNAQYQAAWRERQREERTADRERIADLEADVSRLSAENGRLRTSLDAAIRESAGLRDDLEAAGSAAPRCPHPAEAISDGRCTACGEWL